MKSLVIFLPLGLLAVPALGQTIEYSGRATASLGRFGGNDAAASTAVYQANNVPNAESSRAVNPYGSKLGVGGGLAARVQYVTKYKVLGAFDLGYDLAHSRADVTAVNYNSIVQAYSRTGSGTVHLYTHTITAFAGGGYRLGSTDNKALDVLVGPELAVVAAAHENGSGTDNTGSSWSTSLSRPPANRVDFRLRGDITFWMKQIGVVASYSYGLSNYRPSSTTVPDPSAHMQLLRVGLAYRLQ